MYLVVDTAHALSGQVLPDESKMYLANVWTEVIGATIPAERLQDCLSLAIKRHEGRFAVNAYELLAAWKVICQEGTKPPGCEICLNSAYRDRMSLQPGEIYDEQRDIVTRCECVKSCNIPTEINDPNHLTLTIQ